MVKLIFVLWLCSFVAFANSVNENINGLSKESIVWADSIYNTLSFESRVAQLFMVSAESSLLIKGMPEPGFIAGSANNILSNSSSQINPLAAFLIPEIRDGFVFSDTYLPFPDERTNVFVNDETRQNLKKLFYHTLNQKGINNFLASNKCSKELYKINLLNEGGAVSPDVILSYTDDNDSALGMYVYRMPKQMISMVNSRLPRINQAFYSDLSRKIFTINSDNFIPVVELSAEQLLSKGAIFVSNNYEEDLRQLSYAFSERWLKNESLEKACKLVLAFKYESIIRKSNTQINISNINKELLLRKTYENSVAVFQHEDSNPFPLLDLELKVGFYTNGAAFSEKFKMMACNYLPVDYKGYESEEYDLIFWLTDTYTFFEKNIDEILFDLKSVFTNAKIVMVYAGNPQALPFYDLPKSLDALIYSPANIGFSWEVMAQVAFNGINTSVANSSNLFFNSLLGSKSRSFDVTRFKYGVPIEVGFNIDTLKLIDDIVLDAIKKEATPGAQLLIAKNGVVVWQKSYGWHTYDKKQAVQNSDLYDVASITKAAATMPVLMHLYDIGRWRLADEIKNFLPETDTTNKADITMRQLLLHESGLPSFISFFVSTIDRDNLDGSVYNRRRSAVYSIRVDERLYMNKNVRYRENIYINVPDLKYSIPVARYLYLNRNYLDSMHVQILNAKVNSKRYVYSDLNFLLLQRVAENLSNQSLDKIAYNQFYNSLGAGSLLFNPWRTESLEKIIPTEDDKAFRRQMIHGYVHDPGAAMMGGVAGHAGLFANANDLAKLMQMFVNEGVYGGKRYLHAETIKFFTQQQHAINRRGLGFDKPEPDPTKNGPVSKLASLNSYGHTGFTGTIMWVDPDHELVYIFLSNRIHPHQYNRKLIQMNVRTKIQDVIYRAIEK